MKKVLCGTSTNSAAEDENMSDVSSSSYMSISQSDHMDIDKPLIMWKELGYPLERVIDQGESYCCIPATIAECLTIGVRFFYRKKELSTVSIQYLIDNIPRPLNVEKCTFEDAYSFLVTKGAVFDENYSIPFTTGYRNNPPGQVTPGPIVKIGGAYIVHNPTPAKLRDRIFLECLEECHPLIGGIYLTGRFASWDGVGLYYPSGDYILDANTGAREAHALLIVDYRLNEDQDSISFKVKNTAGDRWADGGYAWIDGSCLMLISCPTNPRIVT